MGGGLYNGDTRLASYAHVWFHGWTGDTIKPSHAGVEPAGAVGIADVGEGRYTRDGENHYDYRYLLRFSLLRDGTYAFAFATGDDGDIQDATIGYTVGMKIDPRPQPWPTIEQKHDDLAQGGFVFGDATSDEQAAPDGIGRYRHYQNGSLYWSPGRGAHVVYGAIRDRWAQLGWERSVGYPLTDEMGAPDGKGRFNHFQDGSIYFTPETGPHLILGAIREKWAALGSEKSYLGYPTTDETPMNDAAGTRYNNFQGGSIRWTAQTGAQDSRTPV